MRLIRNLIALLLFAAASPLAAQDDILTGRVTGEDGKPIVGARIEVISAETEITRSQVTDGNGRYTMVFPDGGGIYVMRVSFLGMEDQLKKVERSGSEELLVTNVIMKPKAIALATITAAANRGTPTETVGGEQSTTMSQDQLNRLPLPDLDAATLASLAAGVIATSDSSGRAGFSVAGMSDLLNQITLNGVVVGGDGSLIIPQEGVRQTQVTTNTFDASRGGFAGGQVSMQTARGNNRKTGSFSYTLNNDNLQSGTSANSVPFVSHNLGGSFGGPIINNKLFYNGSFSAAQRTNYRFALADDALGAQRSGVALDSITRFLGILQNDFGFPVANQLGDYSEGINNYSFSGRMDWNILQRQGQSQTLSLNYTQSLAAQDSARISSLSLSQNGGDTENNNRLASLALSSRFANNWTNNLNMSFSEGWSDQIPFIQMPVGSVRVSSDFEDGTSSTNSLQFGGNRNMPQESYNRSIQMKEDLSLLLPVGGQIHRLKVGGNAELSKNVSRQTDGVFGTFTYNSLSDFQSNRPESYSRALQERNARTGTMNAGVYVGDTWRVSVPLEITLGLRWDYSILDQKPEYNPAIETAFGRRTDITPSSQRWTPRMGFNYRLNEQGTPQKSISGGIGMFAGQAPTSIFSQAIRQTGLPSAEQSLRCIGDATPIPDWDLYAQGNVDLLPDACADGGLGTPLSSRAPSVTLIDPNQSMPSSLRFNLGYRAQLPRNIFANVGYTFSKGVGLWGYRDINLNEEKTFQLGNENRTFYGDPSAIVTRTGATSYSTSRENIAFGNVYDVISSRESQTHQVSASLGGMLFTPKLPFSFNYTLGFAKDQGSGSFAQATTAGNPNEAEWATASNDRRHTMNVSLSWAVSGWMQLAILPRLSSGSPFTPMVDRDINGDGARNDRAFVFDPSAAPDTALANGMNRLLGNVSSSVKECVTSQFGGAADRNSCRQPWTKSLSGSLSLRPNLPTLQRRMTIKVDANNILTGLDQLVNGSNSMKGWGEGVRYDPNLLQVRGFNPATNAFIYEVNEGFGQARRGQGSFRTPFSLTINARVMVGGQPQQSNVAFGQGFGGGRGGFGGGGFGGGAGGFGGGPGGGGGGRGDGGQGGGGMGAMMGALGGLDMAGLAAGSISGDSLIKTMIKNPVPQIIAMKDSLKLTPEQLEKVQAASDLLETQLLRRRTSLKPTVDSMMTRMRNGGMDNPMQMMQQFNQQVQLQIQPHVEGSRRETTEAYAQIQRDITPAQWALVPQRIKALGQPLQGGGGPGGGRGGNFNGIAMLDRTLVSPLPVLIEMKDQLKMSADQVAQLQKLQDALQIKLAERRGNLGKKFEGVAATEQGRIWQEMQPDIQKTRAEITEVLKQAEKILGGDMWKLVPAQIRTPFQPQGGGNRGGGGELEL